MACDVSDVKCQPLTGQNGGHRIQNGRRNTADSQPTLHSAIFSPSLALLYKKKMASHGIGLALDAMSTCLGVGTFVS